MRKADVGAFDVQQLYEEVMVSNDHRTCNCILRPDSDSEHAPTAISYTATAVSYTSHG